MTDDRNLHDALADLVGSIPDDPGRLDRVHRRAARNRRRRIGVTSGAASVVFLGAVIAGAYGFGHDGPSPHGQPAAITTAAQPTAAQPTLAPPTTTTGQAGTSPTTAAQLPPTTPQPGGIPECAPSATTVGPPRVIAGPTWPGTPPPIGKRVEEGGSVTSITDTTATVTFGDGGSVTITTLCQPPKARPGDPAIVELTRTGPDSYTVDGFVLKIGEDRSSVLERLFG
jgi:hypothetical protein